MTNPIALSLFFLATAPPFDWLPALESLVLNSIVLNFHWPASWTMPTCIGGSVSPSQL